MSNFEFLKTEWSDIYELVREAEECVYSKPIYTCILCRNALESAVKWMYKYDSDLKTPYDTTLNSLVHEQSFKNLIVPPLFQKVNLIRINGNTAAHNPMRIDDKDALQTIFELFHFLYWLYLTYSKNGCAGYITIMNGDFSVNGDRCVLTFNKGYENIDLLYLKYLLEPIFRANIKGRIGINGKNEYTKINSTMVKSLNIMIPIPIKEDGSFDIERQRELAQKYATIDFIKEDIYKKIIQLTNTIIV